MNWYYYFVLITLSLVTISTITLIFHFKTRLNGMTGMILSMVTAMNVGLTCGTLFGSLFKGNLFHSTALAILIGVLAGTASGLALGILPTIEGFMSGMMSGMMGAMLGAMIPQEQSIIMINIFLTLSVSSLLLFQVLPTPYEKGGHYNKKWLLKPLFTFLFLATYLIYGDQLNNQLLITKSTSSGEEGHVNHNTQELQKKTEQKELMVNVQPSQFSYDSKKITVKKDQKVTFIFNNFDSIDHDIEIKTIPLEYSTPYSERGADFHLHASGKTQTKLTFTPIQTGSYEFYCTIPGHKERGMSGQLIVL